MIDKINTWTYVQINYFHCSIETSSLKCLHKSTICEISAIFFIDVRYVLNSKDVCASLCVISNEISMNIKNRRIYPSDITSITYHYINCS